MSPDTAAPRFELEHFERSDSGGHTHLVLNGRFIARDAHWLAHTAVLVVRRDGQELARVAPQRDASTATTVQGGVDWSVSFAVRRSALSDDARTTFAIVLDRGPAIELPAPQHVSRPLMVRAPGASGGGETASPRSASGRSSVLVRTLARRCLGRFPRAGRLALACALTGALAAAAGLVLLTRPRHATALIVVTPVHGTDVNFQGLPLLRSSDNPQAVLQTASTVIGQPEVAVLVAAHLGPSWTPASVTSHVKVVPAASGDLIDVTATAPTSGIAKRLADVYSATALALRARQLQPFVAEELGRASANLRSLGPATTRDSAAAALRVATLAALNGSGDPTIRLARPAVVAPQQSRSHEIAVVLLALASGALLGLGGDWFADRMGRRAVRHERRVSKLTGLPILAHFPRAAQPPGLRSSPYTPALQRLLTVLEIGGRTPETIAIISPGSGDGKTTVATELAVHLARQRQSVALLDLDWRKLDAQRRLGVTQALAPSLRSAESGDDVHPLLPSRVVPSLLVGTVGSVVSVEVRASVERALAITDRVVIDTPPLSVSRDALSAAAAAQAVLLVVALETTAESALGDALEALLRIGIRPAGVLLFGSESSERARSQRRPRRRDRGYGIKPGLGSA